MILIDLDGDRGDDVRVDVDFRSTRETLTLSLGSHTLYAEDGVQLVQLTDVGRQGRTGTNVDWTDVSMVRVYFAWEFGPESQ